VAVANSSEHMRTIRQSQVLARHDILIDRPFWRIEGTVAFHSRR